jgi:hypothetical protein
MEKSSLFAALAVALLVVSFACMPTPVPSTEEVAVPTSIPPTPSNTPETPTTIIPTEPPTATPTSPPPTETPPPTKTPPPTETPPPTKTPPPPTEPPPAGLAIISFNVTIEDIPTGKRLTFTWQTTGATGVTIWSGTKQRFPDAWPGPPNGSLVKDLAFTYYRNPSMTLMAYDGAGHSVSKSVTVEWPCKYDYFFPNDVARCPSYEASATWAAEEPFEHGRMIWLEQINTGSTTMQGIILVLYDDGKFTQYKDTWTEGMPESDPSIVPPAGLYQPIRGFGKLWRETPDVRTKLGWATAPEQGFNSVWQAQVLESIGGTAYVRVLSGKIIRLVGWDVSGGTWQYETP